MRNWVVLSIVIAFLAAGCASVPATSAISSENQEKQIQKLLVGTWNGNIKSTSVIITYTTPTLQIFQVKKNSDNIWFIYLSLNGKRINVAELTVNNIEIKIEFIELYANLLIYHRLNLDKNYRLVGQIWYGARSSTPAEVTFEKIY